MAGVTRTCDYCNRQLWDEETGNHRCEGSSKKIPQKEERQFFTGALPPINMQWTVGKTAATVAFVDSVEQYLVKNKQTEQIEVFLKRAILLAKRGELMLTNTLGI